MVRGCGCARWPPSRLSTSTAVAWSFGSSTARAASGRRRFADGVLAHVRTPGGPTGPAQSLLRLTRSSPTPRPRPSLTQSNRRGTDPYARWWGRGGIARCRPIPINSNFKFAQQKPTDPAYDAAVSRYLTQYDFIPQINNFFQKLKI